MKVTKVWVEFGLTVNLNDFNSARARAGIEIELAAGDKTLDAFKLAWAATHKQVKTQLESELGKKVLP